jgi:hypothetical protein
MAELLHGADLELNAKVTEQVTGYSCFLAACAPIIVACGAIPVALPGLRQGEANSNIGSVARSPASPSLRHGYKKKPIPPFPPLPPANTHRRHPNPSGSESSCSMQCNFGFRVQTSSSSVSAYTAIAVHMMNFDEGRLKVRLGWGGAWYITVPPESCPSLGQCSRVKVLKDKQIHSQ